MSELVYDEYFAGAPRREPTYDERRRFSPQFDQGAEAGERVGAARALAAAESIARALREENERLRSESAGLAQERDWQRAESERLRGSISSALDAVQRGASKGAIATALLAALEEKP